MPTPPPSTINANTSAFNYAMSKWLGIVGHNLMYYDCINGNDALMASTFETMVDQTVIWSIRM